MPRETRIKSGFIRVPPIKYSMEPMIYYVGYNIANARNPREI